MPKTTKKVAKGGALARRASFLTRAPPVTFLGGALSAVRVQCNYLDI